MKFSTMFLTLVLIVSTAQAGLFTHKAKDSPPQQQVKAQSFPVFCTQCQQHFVTKPTSATVNGGHTDPAGTVINEWSLSFQCPNCKTQIPAKHQTFVEPIQTVTPLPPMPKVDVARPVSRKLTTPLPPAPQTVEWRRQQ